MEKISKSKLRAFSYVQNKKYVRIRVPIEYLRLAALLFSAPDIRHVIDVAAGSVRTGNFHLLIKTPTGYSSRAWISMRMP